MLSHPDSLAVLNDGVVGEAHCSVELTARPARGGAASIGQAHLATLQDETEVVDKVRCPGAVEQVDEDLKLLHSLASTASHRWELARQFDVVGLAVLISSTHPGVSVLWPGVLTIGFVLALVLTLYLLWSIFRSGSHKRYD